MPTYEREEIERAFEHKIALQEKDDWEAFGQTFTEDAVYVEHHEGTFRGRDEILAWLIPVMARCKDWSYPIDWVAIDGNRVIYHWQNRLPGKRADGSPYQFAGVSIADYAGNGRWSFQEDIYNWERALEVLREWKAAQR